jgi:hypothetical protein
VFSLDSLKKYNGSQQGHKGHVYWYNLNGPFFGDGNGALRFYRNPMNNASNAFCSINTKSLTVPGDSQGNSELTGMKDHFTCAEIEVF